jgi:type VI secretion system ImpM family protein
MNQTRGPQSGASPVVVFGKTPRMGDFLRIGGRSPAGDALEQFVEQGLAAGEAKHRAAWPSAYAMGATYAFIFRPPRAAGTSEALVGVIRPSVDAVGRRFPLVVYAPALPRSGVPWPHVLPMALGDFLDAAATLLLQSDYVGSIGEMQGGLSQLPFPQVQADGNARDYEGWAAATPLLNAWGVIYGGESGLSAPKAIHTIAEAVGPFRGQESPATKLGLRLPLGAGGVAAAVFWLDVVRRLAKTPGEVRTCFWSFDGTTGCAIVQLGDTPGSTLAELWAPDVNSEYLCDLTVPSSVEVGRFLTRLPPHLSDALQVPHILVRDFLDRLAM